jgi:3-oxoacyl-[acyl-carrier-protein] synthase III
MDAYIKAISVYLPTKVLNNEDLIKEFPEWTVEKIAEKVGVKQRHLAAEDEFVSDMATKAALKLFEDHKINKSCVDFILLCTQSPDYFLPTTACLVQQKLNLSTSCGAIDFNQGCSGYVYGLSLAKGLVFGGIAKNVLLITSETYSKYLHPHDKGNRTIFGDAATATIISNDGILKIKSFEVGTNGEGANNLIVKNGACRNPQRQNITSSDDFGNIISEDHLFMNGSEIFNFTLQAVPTLVNNTIEKNNLSMNSIDFFVFHQANKYMLNHLRKKIGIPIEKFVIDMENTGNTVSSTIPIVLNHMIEENKILESQNILLAGFGVGYSWGGVVIESKT